ncbi:MAG: helix-turn-helix domain-containing protein [Methylophilus sp.]|nr:helix-turn-helix domain-containing protein [Methylophilus sp.]
MNKNLSNINPSITNFDHLPDSAMIRPKPSAQLLGVSIATLWRLIRDKKIPVNRLTERTTTIKAGDLRAFMAGKVEG